MGKVILPLSEGELSEKTIFDRRFVIECCETFHLHWRNLRLELSADNWIQLVEAFETGIAKWRAHGSPLSHPHLELARFLMDTSEVIHPTTANAELCENLYKTLRETHGADAEFWVEDAFVHFHYRDLRVEMPIADFLAFSKTMTAAHTKLRSHTYRPLEDLFRQLDEENIIYVVLRNWEALPESVAVGPHSDLDLLVHPLHVEKVDKLWRGERTHAEDFRVQRKVPVLGPAGEQSYILVDVRSTDDGYMPEDWCHRLLSRRVPHKMFHVLPPRDYFVSLLYHAVAHKGVMSPDYAQRLLALAAEAGIDTDLSRIGDFREACRIFADEGVEISKPRDGSVLPKMPYLDPPASVVSSRILDVVDGRPFVSRVAFVEKDGRPIVRKQTTFELAEREHVLLSLLHSDHFPKPIATWRDGVASVCEMELVDGYPLSDLERFVAETSPEGARAFLLECVEILAELGARGITHRDIRTDNILVRDGRPVLIDFGWAVSSEHHYITPAGLGDAGRAPEGFCDAYAMGVALTPAFAHYPELLHVLAAMTRPSGAERVADPAALRELVDAGVPAPAEVAAAVCRIAEQAIGSGALEPAQAALERALEIAPDDAALLAAAGTVRLALGDAAAAETLLERALEIEPESLTARTGLAHAALDQGRVDEARERYAALPGGAPAATIVIPVYNRVDLTRQCLSTLRSSTPSHLYEVVVVDNGSTDETAAFLRRARAAGVLRAVFPGREPRLRQGLQPGRVAGPRVERGAPEQRHDPGRGLARGPARGRRGQDGGHRRQPPPLPGRPPPARRHRPERRRAPVPHPPARAGRVRARAGAEGLPGRDRSQHAPAPRRLRAAGRLRRDVPDVRRGRRPVPAGMGRRPAGRLLPEEPARAPRVGVGHRPRPPRRAGADRLGTPAVALGRQVRDAAMGRAGARAPADHARRRADVRGAGLRGRAGGEPRDPANLHRRLR